MLEYIIRKDGQLVLNQQANLPMVYLDHWALRKVSESQELAETFIHAFKTANATLAVSWVNIVEFSKLASPNAHRDAETFVGRLLPHIFCMEVNPITVRQNEDAIMRGELSIPPHADVELMKLLGGLRPTGFEQFSANGLFASVHKSSGVSSDMDQLTDVMIDQIEGLRQRYATDPKMVKSAKGLPAKNGFPQGTRQIFRELVTTLLSDPSLQLTRNHAIDLLHAVVPLAYCDYVLLDAHWEEQVVRVRRKLTKGGFTFPIAEVFSERRQGFNRFTQALSER